MTQEDVHNHRENIRRVDEKIKKIIEPPVVHLKNYRLAKDIKNELLRRIRLSEQAV